MHVYLSPLTSFPSCHTCITVYYGAIICVLSHFPFSVLSVVWPVLLTSLYFNLWFRNYITSFINYENSTQHVHVHVHVHVYPINGFIFVSLVFNYMYMTCVCVCVCNDGLLLMCMYTVYCILYVLFV